MKADDPLIEVQQKFKQSVEDVWQAITNVHEMRQWFFDNIPDFKASVGFKTRFDVTSEDRVFPHEWEVTEVIPNKKIVCQWTYEGYQGNSYVTFHLSEVDNQTQLTVSTKVTEDFPDDIPEFKRESCIAGWNYFIKDRLVDYLKQ
ncbi:MAG: SRPBCC domain-containing protein [Algicola sp.]|nr:SRPBCC domain-containing protein [Algicola sp.]